MPLALHPDMMIDPEVAAELAATYFGVRAQAKSLPGEIDFNFYLKTKNGDEYTFKISRPGEDPALLDMQVSAMNHLAGQSLPLVLQRPVAGLDGGFLQRWHDEQGRERWLRLLTWAPGRMYAQVKPQSDALRYSLGESLAHLCSGLQYFEHPAAFRHMKWDLAQLEQVAEKSHTVSLPERKAILEDFLNLHRELVAPLLPDLRSSVIYNDANDYNIVVGGDPTDYRVTGFIDFGDAVYTHTINELAIAIAYAIFDQPNPLAAAVPIVRGFHSIFPLRESEIAALYCLVAARLVISVIHSASNREAEPDNSYLLISEQQAWVLLGQWHAIPPALAHYTFRWACDLAPCPTLAAFERWAATAAGQCHPVTGTNLRDTAAWLDLSVGSLDLGHNRHFEEIELFCKKINDMLAENGATTGIGGYGEVRPFYTTDAYVVTGNSGPEWRTVHLGLDIWDRAGTPVYAPLDGWVHSFADNAGERNYGPTIILAHQPENGPLFYTLYGHLDSASLEGLQEGAPIARGQVIARIGDRPYNGNWPPHLHFQVMLDILGYKGDYPGVAFPWQSEVWLSICPDPGKLAGLPDREKAEAGIKELLERRQAHLGRSLSLSYNKPLHVVRGYRQYLYDHTARRYLDTVNNVAHVGHQHPRVVEALQRQAAVLNTNTRYLHQEILLFAEELRSILPPELSVLHFVNSGSEANELALRMGRTATGRRDMLALEVGYHGNTTGCIEVSSYKFDGKGGKGAPPSTHVLPLPDPYRGRYRGNDEATGLKYAAFAQKAIDKAKKGIAGFIGESIISCGGQVAPPPGYFKDIYRQVRAAGGVCIADEVQTGLGRVGDHWWAFELHGVIPDIVTIGKPLGNGHPVGAVACTPAIADAFANGMEYFNTFGGNPVSCAVGRAVIKTIKAEELRENAWHVGNYLKASLQHLQERFPIIGDVRGAGLFLGIELVRGDELKPCTTEASHLSNRMRENGILMSTDGPYHNVLKIKPPICFSIQDADFLIDMLSRVLEEDVFNF